MTKRIISGLITSGAIDRLQFLGRVVSDAQWEIGEIVAELWSDLQHAKTQAAIGWNGFVDITPAYIDELMSTGMMDIYAVVGEQTGCSRRSLSDYYAAVQFYSHDIREEFDVLPFSHFLFARQFRDEWRSVLDLSLHQMELNGGKPPSVEWLEANLRGLGSLELVETSQAVSAISYDLPDTQVVASAMEPSNAGRDYALSKVAQAVNSIRLFIRNLELPGDAWDRLDQAVQNLAEALEAVYQKTN